MNHIRNHSSLCWIDFFSHFPVDHMVFRNICGMLETLSSLSRSLRPFPFHPWPTTFLKWSVLWAGFLSIYMHIYSHMLPWATNQHNHNPRLLQRVGERAPLGWKSTKITPRLVEWRYFLTDDQLSSEKHYGFKWGLTKKKIKIWEDIGTKILKMVRRSKHINNRHEGYKITNCKTRAGWL